MPELGPVTQATLSDPMFAEIMWKLTPASLAVRLSGGQFKTWPYVQLLSRKLVDVAMGRCKRLIVVMPPRHGKSELVSKWFPVWYMENFSKNRIILCSYEAEFAAKWGGKARDIILENQDELTIRFNTKNPAMHHWTVSKGGEMVCAGVGGPITGKGADVFIIDDYVKNSEEANSLTMREKNWAWYTSTARSRMEPGGSVVVMATRWHTDDLIGKILQREQFNIERIADGDNKVEIEGWEVFCFPAEAEPDAERHYKQYKIPVNNLRTGAVTAPSTAPIFTKSISEVIREESDRNWHDILGRSKGEPLCPDRYDERDLARFKSINLRDWFALFQQRPGDEAEDGNAYHQFDETLHCKRLVRDTRMQLFVAIDFNVDPMCVVIGQYDKGNTVRMMERCEILEELVLPKSNTPSMMPRLIQELQKYKVNYTLEVEIYGDAAGTQRSSQSQKTNWQIVAEYMGMEPFMHYKFVRRKSNPMIVDRVNAVNTMLKSADGTTRLYVDDTKCPELIKDFKKVSYQANSDGVITGLLDKSDAKRTHISDALGYMVEYNYSLRAKATSRKGILQ